MKRGHDEFSLRVPRGEVVRDRPENKGIQKVVNNSSFSLGVPRTKRVRPGDIYQRPSPKFNYENRYSKE